MMCLKKKQNDTWQAEDVALDVTWQKDGNVFCFNIYIEYIDWFHHQTCLDLQQSTHDTSPSCDTSCTLLCVSRFFSIIFVPVRVNLISIVKFLCNVFFYFLFWVDCMISYKIHQVKNKN